ncbi:NEP1-interacting protein 1-like isoform X3 [Zingiber officinale]|uniref:NEP1-interacting protein 1-like isoform X3 n=1 Tax=Zingiber officinale TaxID=94328 RepID=UPI001C4B04F2|nr:NEP1-interacting protein 1-like isoform X3 [Zingiber officinale]
MGSLCLNLVRKVAFACLTCTFALCGSMVGLISGAFKGQTTETGIFRGAGIGAIVGAFVSVEFLEAWLQGEGLPKINAAEVRSYRESSDMFDVNRDKGLLPNVIKRLPMFKISCDEIIDSCGRNVCCVVCLQDFIDGDTARMMPMCSHIFHVVCIDVWLVKHASCPTCRQKVLQFEIS